MKENREQTDQAYLTVAEAQRRLGVSRPAITKLVRQGFLGTLRLPGVPTKIAAADVDRLAKESVQRARSI
jgi:excisionase family DNA binding protein